MSKIFINGISSISPQSEEIFITEKVQEYSHNILPALDQDYKSMIKPMLLRRMSRAVKMGIFCSSKALKDANILIPEAILVGSGQGCMQDTEKFMASMLENNEQLLSPTSFIQSTHNTVSGQIALNLKCMGYNMTYTQNSVSFESALLDGMMQLQGESEIKNILVGAVDETSSVFTNFQVLDGQIKQESIQNLDLYRSKTTGTIISESAAFFTLSNQFSKTAYGLVKDLQLVNAIDPENIVDKVSSFISKNNLDTNDIDVVILGINGDTEHDIYYTNLQQWLFPDILQVGFKHLVGENNSISAYAFWLGAKILREKKIPKIYKLNTMESIKPKRILIYNQYLGKNHSFTLLESIEI